IRDGIAIERHDLKGVARQRKAANLGGASIQDMEKDAFSLLHANRLSVAEHAPVDGERCVADFVPVRHALGERGLHRRLAGLFERMDASLGSQEIHGHVAPAAEGGLELLEHQKDFAVVSARFAPRLDVHRPHLAAIDSGSEVGAGTDVGVIEAETSRSWREHDAPQAMRGNVRRSLLGGAIHVGRDILAMPVQLLGRIAIVEHVHDDLPAFCEPEQWARKMPVVGNEGNDAVGRDLDRRSCDPQRVVCRSGLAWRGRRSAARNRHRRAGKDVPGSEPTGSRCQAGGLQKSAPRLCKVCQGNLPAVFSGVRRASRAQSPPPAAIRKSSEQNMAKSVRASLTMNQKPWLARKTSGTFVVAMAVVITTNSGTAVSRVQRPSSTQRPHTISKPPTKCAEKYGYGKPMRVKRTTPIFASVNLRIPWVKKINPTASRMGRMLAGPRGGLKKNRRSEFILLLLSRLAREVFGCHCRRT